MELNKDHRQALLIELENVKQRAEANKRLCTDTKQERETRDHAATILMLDNAAIELIEKCIINNEADI